MFCNDARMFLSMLIYEITTKPWINCAIELEIQNVGGEDGVNAHVRSILNDGKS